MRNKMVFSSSLVVLGAIVFLHYFSNASTLSTQQQPRKLLLIPKWADTVRNPLKNNEEASGKGKVIYSNMCAMCHGDKGKGDGPAGIYLDPRPADHTSAKVQDLTDGAIYWVITNGNPPMPGYKATLKNDERWELVDYIRVLGTADKTKVKKPKNN